MVDPALLSQWFGPKHLKVLDVDTDLRIGGSYAIRLLKPDGAEFSIEGRYIEIAEPDKLVFSLTYKGLSKTPPDSQVHITIEGLESNSSHLTLVQKFDVIPDDMHNRTVAWEFMLAKLHEIIYTAK
jgi:uncharacterized protein YndB with AHSA1/START domain